MARAKGVSAKTHTKAQLDDYANQHNPNNKAYAARMANGENQKKNSSRKYAIKKAKRLAKFEEEYGLSANLDWMCYSNPYDMD